MPHDSPEVLTTLHSSAIMAIFAKFARLKSGNYRLLGREEKFGSLAQLVEQRTFNPLVAGSNPARPTKTF